MITTTAAALVVALLVVALAPVALGVRGWWVRRPQLALLGWLVAMATGAAAVLVAAVAWVFPTPVWEQPSCQGCTAVAAFVVGIGGLGAVIGVFAVVIAHAELVVRAEQRLSPSVLQVSASCVRSEVDADGVGLFFVDETSPMAFSSRSCGRRIVISTGLEAALTPDELRSVVEHERAHLDARHARLVQLAHVSATCFPRLRAARDFESRIHLMVELIADDRAARVCGTRVTADALDRLAAVTSDSSARLRARRLRLGPQAPAVSAA